MDESSDDSETTPVTIAKPSQENPSSRPDLETDSNISELGSKAKTEDNLDPEVNSEDDLDPGVNSEDDLDPEVNSEGDLDSEVKYNSEDYYSD